MHLHVRDMIVVLEEGNHPLLWCAQCDMLFSWEALHRSHLATVMCAKGTERKRRRRIEEEDHVRTEATFQSYVRSLEVANSFEYLGRVLIVSEDDWAVPINNMIKACRK